MIERRHKNISRMFSRFSSVVAPHECSLRVYWVQFLMNMSKSRNYTENAVHNTSCACCTHFYFHRSWDKHKCILSEHIVPPPFCRSIKGMLLSKFTPIFYWRIVIYSSNLEEQKKPHQKILIFDEVMACQSLLIFQLISNASKIFPRCMTSLEPNVGNSVYISIHFHYICI